MLIRMLADEHCETETDRPHLVTVWQAVGTYTFLFWPPRGKMALVSPLFFFPLHFPAFYFMLCSSGVSDPLSDASPVQALRARGWARRLALHSCSPFSRKAGQDLRFPHKRDRAFYFLKPTWLY